MRATLLTTGLLFLSLTSPAWDRAAVGPAAPRLPLRFESACEGGSGAYFARGRGYSARVATDELAIRYRLPGDTQAPASELVLRWSGANSQARLVPVHQLPGRVNYFQGSDPAKWRRNVPVYGGLRCEEVYPGIDAVYYANSLGELEFDLIVRPGADPRRIALEVSGADLVSLPACGEVLLQRAGAELRLREPVVYQESGGIRQRVAGHYLVTESREQAAGKTRVTFEIGRHDPNLALVIDPVVSYSTYVGGNDYDLPFAVATDSQGSVYIAGYTQSPDFPTWNARDASLNQGDAFVAKLLADGTGFAYATFLGGQNGEFAHGIAVDPAGNAYVTGYTDSAADFPLVTPAQIAHGGGSDAFVAKLSADGSILQFSTFLGGASNDRGRGIAVAADGSVVVIGTTASENYPTTAGAPQPSLGGGVDAFVTRLTPAGSALAYSTYLGGSGDEGSYIGLGVALDGQGNACVEGTTTSTNFPTTPGALQRLPGGGGSDAFVAKINSTGTGLLFSTYLGGSAQELGYGDGIALDREGYIYVCGGTVSDDFPTRNAWHPTLVNRWQPQVSANGFVSKLTPDGSGLVYSTYLQGVGFATGVAVDDAGCAHLTGGTLGNLPVINAVQPQSLAAGKWDAFAIKLDPDGQSALYCTYLGGTEGATGHAIATDRFGNAFIAGPTASTNFPTHNALQTAYAGGPTDGFLTCLSAVDVEAPTIVDVGNYGASNVVLITFSEAIHPMSATNPVNYRLDKGVTVVTATMGTTSRTVRLETSGLTPGTVYTLTTDGVSDRAPAPNRIAPDSTVAFQAMELYRGFLAQDTFNVVTPDGSLLNFTNHPQFPNQPLSTTLLQEFETLPNSVIQQGVRLRGWLVPPVSGDYTFFLCGGSQAALFVSRDELPLNRVQLALESCGFGCGGSGPRHWNHVVPGYPLGLPAHVSLPVRFEAGQAYYVEVLAASSGANLVGLAWRGPGQPAVRNGDPPITGAQLAWLASPSTAPLELLASPLDVTVVEGGSAQFTVRVATSAEAVHYQWRRNGIPIEGAHAAGYIVEHTVLEDEASVYDCVVTIPGARAVSAPGRLSVTRDQAPPELLSAEGQVSNHHLTLVFSEPVRTEDATNPLNYLLSGGLTVSNAALMADGRTAVLTTSAQTPGAPYTVQALDIRDRSVAANSRAASVIRSFFGWQDEEFVGPFPSWANVKDLYGAAGDGQTDDTAALQRALDEVATPGHPAVLYLPAGTYRITRSLQFFGRVGASLVGEAPETTVIRWDGPAGGEMMFANGVAYTRWSRLTWDGSGAALIAVHHGHTGGGYQITGNLHTDEIFQDVGAGLVVDPVNGGDSHTVVRCHFLRCSLEGIAVSSYNAIDWHIWDSVFADCAYGVISFTGNFHVYRSLFLRSTEMDVRAGQMYTGLRSNLSFGSRSFVNNRENGHAITLQGNTIVDAIDPTPIRWPGTGSRMLLLDNTIVSGPGADNAPAIDASDNLMSIGNVFTASSPLARAGRSLAMQDRTVPRSEFSPPPPIVPRFLPRSASPVIEVAPGASAASIQAAIDAAARLNGQRPVVHLPAGRYDLDRMLRIPAGCDLQLVGDGFSGHATTLHGNRSAVLPVLLVEGPARATLRDFHVLGGISGVVIENCDQPGARVFFEHVSATYTSSNNLVLYQLDHADVSFQDLTHSHSQGAGMRVIGGPLQAAGQTTEGRVCLFGGGTGGGNLTYQVEAGGRLLVQDTWFEAGPGFLRLIESGSFTLNNAQVAPGNESHTANGPNGAIRIEDFRGRASFLNANIQQTTATVTGTGTGTELLLMGCTGYPDTAAPPFPTYLDNQSPQARVEHLLSSSSGRELPHLGSGDPAFLEKMLAQARRDTPRRLVPLSPGVTDLRVYRVGVEQCDYGWILSGSNGPPDLSPLPIQVGEELSLMTITNAVTGPDAKFGLHAFTFAGTVPSGMTMDAASGVIRWTPTEAQGPSTNQITVVATSLSSPLQRATNTLTVVVREQNQPPELLPDRLLTGKDLSGPNDQLTPGSTQHQPDGRIEVVADGFGFYIPGDLLHFSHEQVDGDFDVSVEVESLEAVAPGSAAGLMARTSLDFDSPFVALDGCAPPREAWRPHFRAEVGAFPQLWEGRTGGAGRFPIWFRLQRQGQQFRGLVRYADTDWQEVGRLTPPVPFPSRLFLGLCTWNRNAGTDLDPGRPTRAIYRNYGNAATPISHAVMDRVTVEGGSIRFQAVARDSDIPSTLSFSLDPGAPAGASIDPRSGLFSWTPSEAQGPGAYPIALRVTDNGEPPLSATRGFTLTVTESNAPPQLGFIGDRVVDEHDLLEFTVAAADPDDIPPNALSLSVSGLPPGAEFDAATGRFSWTPSELQGAASYPLTFTVTDDGSPALSDSESVIIQVRELNLPPVVKLAAPPAGTRYTAPGSIALEAEAADPDGAIVRVEFYDGVQQLGASSTSPFRFLWTNVVAGVHLVSAKAMDDAGGESQSPTVEFTVLSALSSAIWTRDGDFEFRLAGEPGRRYIIERSQDLQYWAPTQTNAVDSTGWLVVREGIPSGSVNHYYRARLEP